MSKSIAILACRNSGSRLYGKPLQNLDVKNNITILDQILSSLRLIDCIEDIILAISEGEDNTSFIQYAKKNNLKYVIGHEIDVLGRIIYCANKFNVNNIFRVTSESPFLQHEYVEEISNEFFAGNYDVAFFDKTIDGCNFEIFTIESLIDSHERGNKNHRSEMVSSFIRENRNDFKILQKYPDPFYYRTDLRLTVDNPEDLVVCREVYTYFKDQAPLFNLREIINYLDTRNDLKKLISPFCEKGYDLMYN